MVAVNARQALAECDPLRILLIEDSPADARLVREALSEEPAVRLLGPAPRLILSDRLSDGLSHLAAGGVDAVLLDLGLPDVSGLEAVAAVRRGAPHVPVVVLSGNGDPVLAADSVREGAQDYVVKDQLGEVGGELLIRSLRYAIERKRADEERARALEEERLARRLRTLADASRAFSAESELPHLLDAVTRSVSTALGGDGTVLFLLGEDGEWLHVASWHSPGPEHTAFFEALSAKGRLRVGEGINGRVAATGEGQLLPSVDPRALSRVFGPAYRRLLDRYPAVGLLCVPLRVQGRLIGTLAAGRHQPASPYAEDDRLLLQDLADRAALAIHAARQYREARAASDRIAFLAEAGEALASSLDYAATLRRVAELAVPVLADFCVVDLVADGGRDLTRIERVAAASRPPMDPSLADGLRAYPPDPHKPAGVAKVLRTGQPLILGETPDDLLKTVAQDARHLELLRASRFTASMIVPLAAGGEVIGGLTMCRVAAEGREDRPAIGVQGYGPQDLTLATQLAQRAALAITHARLYREAAEAVTIRDRVLGAVTHDLRSPLAVVKGTAQLMDRRLETAGADLAEHSWIRTGLSQIHDATYRMACMLDELVDTARLQAGRSLDLVLRPTDLWELVARCVSRHAAGGRGVVGPSGPAPIPLVGMWDPARLERILDNLLSNALKFSPADAPVRVEVSRDVIGEDPWAVVRIRDRGVGIPAEDLPRVFEPFYRASNVAGRVAGTGLGLAGSRTIVEQHGGAIAIESTVGQGTTVTVRLPLQPPARTGGENRQDGREASVERDGGEASA